MFHEDIISVHSFSLYIHKYIIVLISGIAEFTGGTIVQQTMFALNDFLNVWRVRKIYKRGSLWFDKEGALVKNREGEHSLVKNNFILKLEILR